MKSIYRTFRSFAVIAIAMVIVSGCTTQQAARNVATHTTATLATYEKQVNDKVTTEKAFYRNETTTIRKYLSGEVDLSARSKKNKKQEPIERSLLYGKIVNGANHDGRLAAESMVYSSKVNVMRLTSEFIRKGTDDDLAFYRELSERRTRLKQSFIKELAKIDQQKKRLAKVKKGLAKLSKSPDDPGSSFKLIKKFAPAIMNTIKTMSQQ